VTRRAPSRRSLDFGRIAEAVSRPGIDPRAWVALARVDDDPDAVVWDADLGWTADVTFAGGPLAGEGPVSCRVASPAQGAGAGRASPVRQGGLVVVVIPSGDPNEDAVIVGQLHDVDDARAPTSVNGDSIVETDASSGQVAADVTHLTALPDEDLDEEWRSWRVTADAMTLGVADADQPFVRGDDQADALDDLADALGQFAAAIAVAPVVGAAVALDPATLATFQQAIAAFKAARQSYLSTRIKGD